MTASACSTRASAGVREPHAAPEPRQQRGADLGLEPRDLVRDRGLRVAEARAAAESEPSRATARSICRRRTSSTPGKVSRFLEEQEIRICA